MTFDFSLAPRNAYIICVKMDKLRLDIESMAVKEFGSKCSYRRSLVEGNIYMMFSGNVHDIDEKNDIDKTVTEFDIVVNGWLEENNINVKFEISVYWQ